MPNKIQRDTRQKKGLQFVDDDHRIKLMSKILLLEEQPQLYEQLSQEEIFNIVCHILNKTHYHRTHNEVKLLMRAHQKVQFFQNLLSQSEGGPLFEKCCRKMNYQCIPAGTNVFREGDEGDSFYVLLKGRVQILKQIPESPSTNKLVERELAQLNDGCCFGELALLNKSPRSATVKTITNCHFSILESEDFQILVKIMQQQQQRRYFEEFGQLRCLNHLPFHIQKQLHEASQLEEHGMNSVIFKQEESANKVYFILEGEVNITKRFNNTLPDERTDNIEDYYLPKSRRSPKAVEQVIEKISEYHCHYKLAANEELISTSIKRIGEGEIFGDLELFDSHPFRQFTATTSKEFNRLYSISYKAYLRILSDVEMNQTLKETVAAKRLTFTKQIVNHHRRIVTEKNNFNLVLPQQKQELFQLEPMARLLLKKNLNALKTFSLHSNKYSSRQNTSTKSQKASEILLSPTTSSTSIVSKIRSLHHITNKSPIPRFSSTQDITSKAPVVVEHSQRTLASFMPSIKPRKNRSVVSRNNTASPVRGVTPINIVLPPSLPLQYRKQVRIKASMTLAK